MISLVNDIEHTAKILLRLQRIFKHECLQSKYVYRFLLN